jgi:molybdopterin/thiamine biosynthesis adenylyltransferase/rhodanese-related sulfurtransferase/molybdopterin converting factor small subunit
MARIALPTPLRPYAGGRDSVEAPGSTVGEALAQLTTQHPTLQRHLFDEAGRLRSFVNVYKGEEDVRFLQGPATPLGENDTLWIVPSIAGGAPTTEEATPALSLDEIRRYARHLIIPEVGLAGQRQLKAARVLCVGAGGLGSPLSLYLAAAGVGTLGLVDFDVVDDSNLQRQILHGTSDVGRKKLDSAAARLKDINPNVRIVPHETRLSAANALDLLRDYDVVADGTDNFPTRYLVNDACVLLGKPNVYASVFQFEGQVSVFNYRDAAGQTGPNYRDLYPVPPPPGLVPSCAEGGVLGVLPGIIGSMQASEVIKVITGIGEPLSGRFFIFDALSFETRTLRIRRRDDNPVSGMNPTITALVDYEQFCGMKAVEKPVREITARELLEWQTQGEKFQLIDVREPDEYARVNIGGELIPLGQMAGQAGRVARDRKVVIHCKTGGRGAKAIRELEEKFGFDNLYNLKGGIFGYIDEVQPELSKY